MRKSEPITYDVGRLFAFQSSSESACAMVNNVGDDFVREEEILAGLILAEKF